MPHGIKLPVTLGLLVLAAAIAGSILAASALGGAGTPPLPDAGQVVSPTWLPGLPIDTPPAVQGTVADSAPPGEEKQWTEIAAWARIACGFDGGKVDSDPEAMFKTTAGELRRLNAARQPQGLTLGSNWRNDDTLFIVIFRGIFPHRPGPPRPDRSSPVVPPPGNACVYYGNGRVDDSDNAMVGHTTLRRPVVSIEDLLAQ